MRRPVFLSFCYGDDVTRVQQIRNMGMVEEQQILSPNDFEQVVVNPPFNIIEC